MENLDKLEIEEKEKEVLLKLGWIFKDSLKEFSTSVDRSLKYLDKIVLPIIMASKEDKSYNPFSQIIEKYVLHILTRKFEKEGYSLLPLGYSADLTLENDYHILNIDVKTANLENSSDFQETINVGINQLTHVAKLKLGKEFKEFLPSPYFVYPTIPPFYEINGSKKLILTYGLMFIYPSYSDLIKKIRDEYNKLVSIFNNKVKNALAQVIESNFNVSLKEAYKILESKPEKSRYTKGNLITESLIRGVFIHKQERESILNSLKMSKDDCEIINEFSKLLDDFVGQLRSKDIKPIAIIAISLPNGLLKDKYIDKFVSGKDYAKSARYHYKDGIFEVIKEKTGKNIPRVIFLDLNDKYKDELKKYFKKIFVLDYELKEL